MDTMAKRGARRHKFRSIVTSRPLPVESLEDCCNDKTNRFFVLMRALLGWQDQPTPIEFIAWFLYWGVALSIGFVMVRRAKKTIAAKLDRQLSSPVARRPSSAVVPRLPSLVRGPLLSSVSFSIVRLLPSVLFVVVPLMRVSCVVLIVVVIVIPLLSSARLGVAAVGVVRPSSVGVRRGGPLSIGRPPSVVLPPSSWPVVCRFPPSSSAP